MGEKILEIEGITKKYKDFKLEPVSFSLEAGRLMSVMGAYGAGKTTLFKLLTGQLRMDEGNVIFFEKGEVLERALRSYMAYYDVERETPEEPFAAEAAFHSHSSTYFLTKSATIGEAESNEYVFFALADRLDEELFRKLDHAAWEKGLARVKPHTNHLNTDISLVVIASSVTEGAENLARRQKHYKSYRLSLHGFSHYRLIVLDLSNEKTTCNRQGHPMKKIFSKIFTLQEKERKK